VTDAATSQRLTEPTIGRRIASRTRCELVVEIKEGGADWGQALLCDVSTTGFKLSHLGFAPTAGSLWLRLPGLEPFPAKICWKNSASVGCEFLYPLSGELEARVRKVVLASATGPNPWQHGGYEALCA
jgi:hypothetical protein